MLLRHMPLPVGLVNQMLMWSGKEDLNLRPLAPKASALTGLSYSQVFWCPRLDSHQRPFALQANALLLSYRDMFFYTKGIFTFKIHTTICCLIRSFVFPRNINQNFLIIFVGKFYCDDIKIT